jgi:hypothetical protein
VLVRPFYLTFSYITKKEFKTEKLGDHGGHASSDPCLTTLVDKTTKRFQACRFR